jgi:iron complex transport system permease protein
MTVVAARPTPPGPAEAAPTRRSASLLTLGLLAGAALLLLLVFLSVSVGTKSIDLATVWSSVMHDDGSPEATIIRDLRVPRTVLGVLVGAAMALAGALMQALSRNPLADPGIFGVNSGAALAVVCAIALGGVSALTGYVWFAMLGAGIASLVVYLLGSSGRANASPVRLALAGTAIAAVCNGVISALVLVHRGSFSGFRSWSVGSLADRPADVVWQVLPFVLVGVVMALLLAGPLNALALGDDTARALGAKVAPIRVIGVLTVTLLCGAGTAAVGPIGFVGLVVPHAARAISGPNQRWLLPYCLVFGPVLLFGSDIVGRVVLPSGELQVSIVTAAVGAPVFIWLVRRRRVIQL